MLSLHDDISLTVKVCGVTTYYCSTCHRMILYIVTHTFLTSRDQRPLHSLSIRSSLGMNNLTR